VADEFQPIYLRTWARDPKLAQLIAELADRARECRLCPHHCRVNRLENQAGRCRTGRRAVVSTLQPHFGEEQPIYGLRGSGTIFFAHCNLYCVFCQNADISHEGKGYQLPAEVLAEGMMDLQRRGCHNINLVTPSHQLLPIVEALALAVEMGLQIPLVYNTSGYDDPESLSLLHQVVDIYMPDLKFLSADLASRWTIAPDYPAVACRALESMQTAVGDLQLDQAGVATRGLLVRHLVMPGQLDDSLGVLRFLAEKISPNVYVNIMSQYHPSWLASRNPPLNRLPTRAEYAAIGRAARELNLARADFQWPWRDW